MPSMPAATSNTPLTEDCCQVIQSLFFSFTFLLRRRVLYSVFLFASPPPPPPHLLLCIYFHIVKTSSFLLLLFPFLLCVLREKGGLGFGVWLFLLFGGWGGGGGAGTMRTCIFKLSFVKVFYAV